jgi:hypothetical protein
MRGMGECDRRTAIKLGGIAALAALAPGAALAAETTPHLFVFDARYARSRAAAGHWRDRGVGLLDPRERDLGLAWRDEIPRIIERGGEIAGLTPWSDRLLCEMMGRELGAMLRETASAKPLHGWRLA